MIIKFKIFENQELVQRYWKVLIDDNLFVSLNKIGMPNDIQNDLYEHLIDIKDDKDYKFVMVGHDHHGDDWHWDFNQARTNEFYVDTLHLNLPDGKYVYQGVVEVTQNEIDDWKLKNDAKRYNL
jgi:hypothetical protein